MKMITLFLLLFLSPFHSCFQEPAAAGNRNDKPAPTYADLSYGPHERQVFDLWLTPSKDGEPTPLVIYIHGGGFRKGNKYSIRADAVRQFMEAGLSVAAIHYRLSDTGLRTGEKADERCFCHNTPDERRCSGLHDVQK